jgi:hypothetical protein
VGRGSQNMCRGGGGGVGEGDVPVPLGVGGGLTSVFIHYPPWSVESVSG